MTQLTLLTIPILFEDPFVERLFLGFLNVGRCYDALPPCMFLLCCDAATISILLLFTSCYCTYRRCHRCSSRFTVHGSRCGGCGAHRAVRAYCGSRPSIVPPHATFEHEFLIEGGEEQRKEIVTCVPPLFTHHTSHIQYSTPPPANIIILLLFIRRRQPTTHHRSMS